VKWKENLLQGKPRLFGAHQLHGRGDSTCTVYQPCCIHLATEGTQKGATYVSRTTAKQNTPTKAVIPPASIAAPSASLGALRVCATNR
jgi:hypothetical protein